MTTTPAITVLMPVYNGGPFLREAINSVLRQTFSDYELLIIDDASMDGSSEIIASLDDPRVRVITHSRNLGLVASLNDGLDQARGQFIARMDADDVMLPHRLEKQFRYLEEHPTVALVAAFVDVINPDGDVTGVWETDRAAVSEEEIRKMMPRTTCIAHPTVMIRRSALGSLRYDARMSEGEDWDLWLRMQSRGLRIAKIPEALLLYRQHPNSFTGAAKARRPLERRLLVMRRRFLLGEWGSLRFRRLHHKVLKAQARSLARHAIKNVLPPLMRSAYRILTYSPVRMITEWRSLQRTLSEWKGKHVFLFPYLSMGGAEQVHTGIVGSVKDRGPLVVICGFSIDRAFEQRFTESATVLEIPRLLNHPWTSGMVQRAIARKIDSLEDVTLLGSLTNTFFDLLPRIKREVRTYFIQHAFLYQPGANLQQKGWLKHFVHVNGYLFPSGMAMMEFDKFLFHQNIPASRAAKLLPVPCAAPVFGEVNEHSKTGVLFVGRDSPEKRLSLFLSITAELEAKFPGRLRFTVVGPEQRTGYPHVVFKGVVRDMGAMSGLYSDNDVLLLTSTREGHCLVVTEAMAHGLVVLSTPVGDVPGRVDGSHAVIATSIDADVVTDEFVAAVLALDEDRARMLAMKHSALAKAKSEFGGELFRDHYRALLTGPSSRA